MDPRVPVTDVARHVSEGLEIVPSSVVLSAVDQELAGAPGREERLLSKLETMNGRYDFAVVDCPPNVGLLTFNAIVACTEALVVLEPSYYALHGAEKVIETVRLVREQLHLRKRIRLLMNLYDRRTRFNKELLSSVRKRFRSGLLETVIRRTIRVKEAAESGIPVCRYDPHCTASKDFVHLAEELIGQESELAVDDFEAVTAVRERDAVVGTPEWYFAHPGPQQVGDKTLFSVRAPYADEVLLVGTFNQWNPEKGFTLSRKVSGLWATSVKLPEGRHLYKFVIDGNWVSRSGQFPACRAQ